MRRSPKPVNPHVNTPIDELSELLGNLAPAPLLLYDEPEKPPLQNQAQNVINKFGSVAKLLEAFRAAGYHVNQATIYRWTYPRGKRKGCDGWIPTAAWPAILEAARATGLILTLDVFDPSNALKTQNEKTPAYIWRMKRRLKKKLAAEQKS